MSSSFTTRVERKEKEPYTVIFKTDDAQKYEHIEFECRRMLGHLKPAEEIDKAQLPKEGEWIPNSPFTGNCSECGGNGNLKDNYCSSCGARMRKGEQE